MEAWQHAQLTSTKRPCDLTSPSFFVSSTLFSRPALEFGVYSQGVTPVTIPNTVVKTLNAYGTAEVTRWESRSMPNSNAGWGTSTLCRGGETGRHAGFKIQWG